MRRRPHRLAIVAFAFLASLGPSTLAWAQQQVPPYHEHMWGGDWHGWLFGPLMMIAFVAVTVVMVVLLVRRLGGGASGGTPQTPAGKRPLDILEERFARGEIDKEEFEERRRVLGA